MKPLSSKGFALAAVLWLLAGLSIVVSLVNDAAVTSAERVHQLRERADFVRSSLATRANMLYFLSQATPQAAGYFGFDTMVLADETPYKFDPLSVVRIQDLGGLVNLNRFERPMMERFMQSCGVEPEQIPFLIDALEDYIDIDDLQRINGAEKAAYAAQSMSPPRNAALLSVDEVWQVFGWAKYKTPWTNNGCARALTTYQGSNSSVNLATAPLMVLRAAGLDEASANDIVNSRNSPEKTSERLNVANSQIGNVGMFGAGGGVVKGDLRVTHEHATLPWVMSYNFKFDLSGVDKPWSFSQPTISARQYSPVIPSGAAQPWPKNSAPPPSASDNKPVIPF